MTEEESYSSPSFNYYSSDKLQKIAAQINNNNYDDDDDDVEFEFCFVNSEHEQILLSQSPQYDVESEEPVLDKDPNLITNRENKRFDSSVTIAMSKLLIHDHECDGSSPPSCSSSDDESENIPAVRYCVWRPKKISETTPSCKKSKSTGSRTCTTIRGFMRRSNSEGKGDFVFLTPKKEKVSNKKKSIGSEKKVAPPSPSPSAHEALYLRNRAAKESYKKKSYLPYRQDLFGFFAGVGKTMPY